MLAGATSVRQVGTNTIHGIPVTEYTGKFPIEKGTAHLSASTKARVRKEMATAGIATATFRVWIDGQHRVRRVAKRNSYHHDHQPQPAGEHRGPADQPDCNR